MSPLRLSATAGEPWHAFGLRQGWGMFVPVPYQGGWYVVRGLTFRGDWVNLETGESVDSLDVPKEMDRNLPTSRHVLLYNSTFVKADGLKIIQARIASNFRHRWESAHPGPLDQLQKVEIYKFYREYNPDDGTFSKPEERFVLLWRRGQISPSSEPEPGS